jgi:hypothetical protein
MKQLTVLSSIWNRLEVEPFTPIALADQIIHDGGMEIEPLTQRDLVNLIEGNFNGNWQHVGFSCKEMLNLYQATALFKDKSLNGREITAWCFIALTMGEACRQDTAEWDDRISAFLWCFGIVERELETEEALYILRQAFAEKQKRSKDE